MSSIVEDEGRTAGGRSTATPGERGVALLLLDAANYDGLLKIVDDLLAQPDSQPLASPTTGAANGPLGARLALAAPHANLRARLQMARARLVSLDTPRLTVKSSGIYINVDAALARQPDRRIAFLFPGQGSQHPGMLRDFCLVSRDVRAWLEGLDAACALARRPPPSRLIDDERPDALFGFEQGVPLSTVAGLALFELVSQLGIRADVLVGHSLGEHAAVLAAGMGEGANRQTICAELCRLGLAGIALEEPAIAEGMATVSALARTRLDEIVARYPQQLYLAMDNSPTQLVLAGRLTALADAARNIVAEGGTCAQLPFARAYHTPFLHDYAAIAQRWYRELNLTPEPSPGMGTRVYSCLTSRAIPGDPVAAAEVMARQWTTTVHFRATIEQLMSEGVDTFVEVGPDAKLTAFVDDIFRGRPHLAVNVAAPPPRTPQRRGIRDIEQLGHMLAALYAHGVTVDAERYNELLRSRRGGIPVVSAPAPIEVDLTHRGSSLLGDAVVVTDNRLTAHRTFTLVHDRFLADHSMGRARIRKSSAAEGTGNALPVLSFTTSLAVVVEAAQHLLALHTPPTNRPQATLIAGIHAQRWLALDNGSLDVHVEATGDGTAVQVTLREETHSVAGMPLPPAFQATVYSVPTAQAVVLTPPSLWESDPAACGPARWTAASFYGQYAFHGPSFQGLAHVLSVGPNSAEALVTVLEVPGIDRSLLHLDPALVDCAGQLVAFWLLEQGGRAPHLASSQLAQIASSDTSRCRRQEPSCAVVSRSHLGLGT